MGILNRKAEMFLCIRDEGVKKKVERISPLTRTDIKIKLHSPLYPYRYT